VLAVLRKLGPVGALACLAVFSGNYQVHAQRVILSEDFESDVPDMFPTGADFYARSCVQFVNCPTEPAKIVVTGGAFSDPFGAGNQSVILHNPNSAAQMAITWTSAFEDDPATFKNGVIEFDVWLDKPLPVLGQPGGKFWSFLDARLGFGGADRNGVSTVGDVTIWDNFRVQNLFPPTPDPVENVVDAGAQFTVGLQTTYTDPVPNGLMAPNQSFHVKYEINGTAGSESYILKLSDTAITWLQDGEMSHPWVPGASGVNILSFLTDASAFSTGAGAGNVYLDNLVVTNNDLPPGLDGDYNSNGTVDAADYVLWRNGGPLQNEVDTPGTVNAADYTEWRARFGNSLGPGFAAGVPEPASWVMLLLVFALANWGVRQRCCAV
jgi:hypothetical protein